MRGLRVKLAAAVAVVGIGGVGAVAVAHDRGNSFAGFLTGYEEVPAVSSGASGTFHAAINRAEDTIAWKLTYTKLDGDVQQAHIHFGQRSVNGGVSVFLCSNLPNPPAGTQNCPPPPAKITGTATAAQVIGPGGTQGLDAGEFAELVRAMRAGITYANVHSTRSPGGEIRTQIERRGDH
jgi:CHRD domain